MAIAIAAINKSRKQKNRKNINCLALTSHIDNSESNELKILINQLKEEIKNIPENYRIQIVYNDHDEQDSRMFIHWTSIDIILRNGQIEFFILDAANSLPNVLNTIEIIHNCCPEANITYSGGEIQHDNQNCGYFALDHAVAMAGIENLHDAFPQEPDTEFYDYIQLLINSGANELARFLPSIKESKIKYVMLGNFPQNFGSLLKNVQGLSMYERIYKHNNFMRNNKKPLNDYINAHIKFIASRSLTAPPKAQNTAIIYKKNKIQEKSRLFLNQINREMLNKILVERNVLPEYLPSHGTTATSDRLHRFEAASSIDNTVKEASAVTVPNLFFDHKEKKPDTNSLNAHAVDDDDAQQSDPGLGSIQ